MMEVLIVIMSIVYIIYLLYEYKQNIKMRERFLCVIHVNGTRGKSSVCRLIDAGLRTGGYKVFTKTTGTSPRIIDIHGREQEISRKGKPNIREQVRILKVAAEQNAEILVMECMAVNPELQHISENRILKADIGVITNVRRDHLIEMGPRLSDIARSLGNVMPQNGIFVTADEKFYDYYMQLAKNRNTKTILVKSSMNYDIDFNENVTLALEICGLLGIDKKSALEAMRNYNHDPGRLSIYSIKTICEKEAFFINAFAANDPDSTLKIYQYVKGMNFFAGKRIIMLINNRIDRIGRMEQLAKFLKCVHYDDIWIMGNFTKTMKRKLITKEIPREKITICKSWTDIDLKSLKDSCIVFGIGNVNGYGKEMVDFVERVGENLAG